MDQTTSARHASTANPTNPKAAPTAMKTVPSGRSDSFMYGAFFVGGTVATGISKEDVDVEVLVDVRLGRVFVVDVDVASVNGGGLLSSVGVDSSVDSDSEESSVLVSDSLESVESSDLSSVWLSSSSASDWLLFKSPSSSSSSALRLSLAGSSAGSSSS